MGTYALNLVLVGAGSNGSDGKKTGKNQAEDQIIICTNQGFLLLYISIYRYSYI